MYNQTTTKTTNRKSTTNRNTNARSYGKNNNSRREYQPVQYFVIDDATNTKIEIGDKEYQILMAWMEIKGQENAVEEQKEALKNSVNDVVNSLGGRVRFRGFNFTGKNYNNYAFSAEVTDLEKRLAELKKKEIDNGTAVIVKATPYVEMKAHKG